MPIVYPPIVPLVRGRSLCMMSTHQLSRWDEGCFLCMEATHQPSRWDEGCCVFVIPPTNRSLGRGMLRVRDGYPPIVPLGRGRFLCMMSTHQSSLWDEGSFACMDATHQSSLWDECISCVCCLPSSHPSGTRVFPVYDVYPPILPLGREAMQKIPNKKFRCSYNKNHSCQCPIGTSRG